MSIIYAMSDIHGHYDEFIESLPKVDLTDTDNRLLLLGDYIDGGSQSFQVILKIIELEKKFPDQVITLLGNHEEYFSEWLFEEDGASKYTSYDTIISFIGQNKRKNIVDTVISDFSLSDEECLAQINKKIRDCVTSEYPEIVGWFRNKYFNSEMKGFSVYARFNQLTSNEQTRFSQLWQECNDDLGISVKNTNDWSVSIR